MAGGSTRPPASALGGTDRLVHPAAAGWAFTWAGLEALGNPTRRAIFELLVGRPQPVRDLADALPVSRPAVSQHLKALKQSGLVIDRAEGTRIYRVDPAGVAAMRAYLEQMWDTALATFAVAVENQEANTKRTRLMITSSLERA